MGDFVFRPVLKTVRPASSPQGSDEIKLPDKAVEVLIYMAARQREVCGRDEILDAVWGWDRDAYDRVLDNAVAEIRRAFGDDARKPKYIQTIPRRGYRLLVPVAARKPRFSIPTAPTPASQNPVSQNPASQNPASQPATEDRDEASHASVPRPPLELESDGELSSDVEVAPTGTEPGATAPSLRRPLVALAILACLAVVAWLWPRAQGVRVEVQASSPQSDIEEQLAARVRQALFAEHPCGERSLVVPADGLRRAALTLTASVEHANGRTMLRIRPADSSAPAVLAQLDAGDPGADAHMGADIEGADIGQFLTDVSASIDRHVCFETGQPMQWQACHCKAATTRTFHKMAKPEPHIELLEQAIDLDPTDVDSYEALAMIYRSLGDKDAAGDTLSAGLAQIDDPASVPALSLRRRLAEALGDFPTEAGLIDQLRRLRPDEPRWILAEAAHSARHRRDCANAVSLIARLGDTPIPPEATRLEDSESVWTCLLHSDRQEVARRRLAQAPQDAGTRFQLALGSVLSGRLDEAHRLANEYLALQPDSADAYWLLGSLEGRQGAYSAARHWLARMEELIKWPNQDHRYRTAMGWTDLREGRADECVERFADMPEGSRPWSVMARWTLGRCQVQAGDLKAARETLVELRDQMTASQTSWQEEFVLHLEASLTAAESDDPEATLRAAEQMIRATELGPADYPYFATESGILLEAAGDLDRALEFYERAVAYSPSYPWSNCRLGLLFRRLDRDEEAFTHLRRALEVFGNPPEGPVGKECADALAELDPTFTVAN